MAIDLDTFMETVGFMLAQEFQEEAPKRDGTLARAFPATMNYSKNKITFRLPHYARPVIEGSAPHVIRAREAKILAVPIRLWEGKRPNPYGSGKFPMLSKNGQFVFLGKKVNHPGNQPNPFMKDVIHRKLEMIFKHAGKISQVK